MLLVGGLLVVHEDGKVLYHKKKRHFVCVTTSVFYLMSLVLSVHVFHSVTLLIGTRFIMVSDHLHGNQCVQPTAFPEPGQMPGEQNIPREVGHLWFICFISTRLKKLRT